MLKSLTTSLTRKQLLGIEVKTKKSSSNLDKFIVEPAPRIMIYAGGNKHVKQIRLDEFELSLSHGICVIDIELFV